MTMTSSYKKASKRIAWYTEKVAQLEGVHPARRTKRERDRGQRLLQYKFALNEWLRSVKEREKFVSEEDENE